MIQPSRLTGPIFAKELRVSSRRRRNYLLRFLYVAALSVFIFLVWLTVVRPWSEGAAPSYQVSRMPEAGKVIIAFIAWFQFCAIQLVAVVMLSTSVSDEIYGKTLGVLMTTPINSLQIVMGKMLSKLLQLLLLLAISFPLLAVVRVFGGVPWDYLVSSLCITLSATLLAASLSMFFSIHHRRAYVVILLTLFTMGFLYLLAPWMVAMVANELLHVPERRWLVWLAHSNPFLTLGLTTERMMNPRGGGLGFSFSWPVTCLVLLGASGLMLAVITARIRKAALRQAVGEDIYAPRPKRATADEAVRQQADPTGVLPGRSAILTVRDPPMIWKELRTPLFRRKRWAAIGLTVGALILASTYLICGVVGELGHRETHITYGLVYVILGILVTAVISATPITAEKEARTWPILLLTPLSETQILLGKAVGVLRRSLPVWVLLLGHAAFFVAIDLLAPVVILHLAMLAGWITLFLTGSGLFFSSCFKRTTTAVVANLALCAVIWAAMPLVLYVLCERSPLMRKFPDLYVTGNPVVQEAVVIERGGTYGMHPMHLSRYSDSYFWPDQKLSPSETTERIVKWSLLYVAAGVGFALLARGRIRAKVDSVKYCV